MSPLLPGKKDVLGVDLGTSKVKVLELKTSGSRISVVNYAEEDISGKVITEKSPEERQQIYIEALRKCLKKRKFGTKNAAVSVSGSSVIVRFVKFPKMNSEDLEKTLQFEAEPHIPFDIQDVDMDTQIIGDVEDEDQVKMETVLVASKKETIREKIEILEKSGLKPAVIDVDAFALENAYEMVNGAQEADSGMSMIVNIGASVTNISIVEGGISKVVRDLYTAGNSFTRALKNSLQLDTAKAEEIKKKYGLSGGSQDGSAEGSGDISAQAYSAMYPVMRELNSEMQRSIDYFTGQQSAQGIEIKNIIISGGGAAMKSLPELIYADLSIPVEVFRPLGKASLSDKSIQIDLASPAFAVAAGLSLRKIGDNK